LAKERGGDHPIQLGSEEKRRRGETEGDQGEDIGENLEKRFHEVQGINISIQFVRILLTECHEPLIDREILVAKTIEILWEEKRKKMRS
jgi:hypothetical protein